MNKHFIEQGFSLVEMAVVLTIVGLLMAGLLPMISGQIEQQHRAETRKQLEEIRNALVGYAASQTPPKLPCPASPTISTGNADAGVSDCTIASGTGVLPWVTLGTSETDAWGRRFTYSIASSVTGAFGTSFTLTSTGNLNILTADSATTFVASGVPTVVISHGTNGLGAYLPSGTQIPTDGTHTDELANSDGSAPFVSHDNTTDFDDLVVWLSPNTLFNRMVAASKLP